MKLIQLLIFVLFATTIIQAQEWETMQTRVPFQKDHPIGIGYNGVGYVLTGGSSNNANTRSVWKYEPDTDTWTALEDYPGYERNLTAADTYEDKLYFGFGYRSAEFGFSDLSDLWVFDPSDESYTQLPSCPCIGRAHPAFVAYDDKIFMGSGSTEQGDLNDWWEYDMITQEWREKPGIPGDVRHHPFYFTIDGLIYVGGGHVDNWIAYDPETETWTEINDEPKGRVAGTQFQYKGKGYLIGGDDKFHRNLPLDDLFMCYDPETDTWERLPVHSGSGRWASTRFIIDGYVYLIGGYESESLNNTLLHRYPLDGQSPSNIEESNSFELTVSPNPFVREVEIKGELGAIQTIEVFDVSGKQLINSNDISNVIDLSSFQSGTYMLVATGKDGAKTTRKVVKQ